MSKYKYLLFDIDDTLINFEKSFHNCAAKVLELGGCEVTVRNVRRFKELNDIVWFSSGLEDIYEPYIDSFKDRPTVVKALCLHSN